MQKNLYETLVIIKPHSPNDGYVGHFYDVHSFDSEKVITFLLWDIQGRVQIISDHIWKENEMRAQYNEPAHKIEDISVWKSRIDHLCDLYKERMVTLIRIVWSESLMIETIRERMLDMRRMILSQYRLIGPTGQYESNMPSDKYQTLFHASDNEEKAKYELNIYKNFFKNTEIVPFSCCNAPIYFPFRTRKYY